MASLKVSRGLHVVTSLEIRNSLNPIVGELIFDDVTDASVATPPTNQRALYFSSTQGALVVKTDAGSVINLESGAGVSFPIKPTITDNGDTWTGTQTLDLSVGDGHVYKWTVDQNLTFAAAVSNKPASGTQRTFELEFVHDGVGGTFTVTLPSNFIDENGKTLTSFTISNSRTVILTARINDNTNFLVIQKNVKATGSVGLQNVVEDTTPQLGGDLDVQTFDILMKGQSLFMDVDADTHLTAATDDILKVTVGTINTVDFLVGSVLFQGAINLDMNGNDIILDVDNDTKINVTGDDAFQIDIGATTQAMAFTATTISFGVGVSMGTNDLSQVGSLLFSTSGSSTGSNHEIWADTNALHINSPTGDTIDFTINAVTIAQFGNLSISSIVTDNAGKLILKRSDATPTDTDEVGIIEFTGPDSVGTDTIYGQITTISRDVSNTTEDGEMKFTIMVAGSPADIMQLIATKLDMLRDIDMNTFDIDFSTNGHSINNTSGGLELALNTSTNTFQVTEGGNPYLEIVGLDTSFGSNTTARFSTVNNLSIYFQLFNPDSTPTDDTEIGRMQFLYGTSEIVYSEIVSIVRDVTAATEDSTLQLKIMSAGSLSTMIDVTSTAAGTKQLGFFGVTPVAKQNPAVTAAGIHAALQNYGLFV